MSQARIAIPERATTEIVGRGEVSVERGDLVLARNRAIEAAQRDALNQYLEIEIFDERRSSVARDAIATLIANVTKYVVNYRVFEEEPAEDRFVITLAVQLSLEKLQRDVAPLFPKTTSTERTETLPTIGIRLTVKGDPSLLQGVDRETLIDTIGRAFRRQFGVNVASMDSDSSVPNASHREDPVQAWIGKIVCELDIEDAAGVRGLDLVGVRVALRAQFFREASRQMTEPESPEEIAIEAWGVGAEKEIARENAWSSALARWMDRTRVLLGKRIEISSGSELPSKIRVRGSRALQDYSLICEQLRLDLRVKQCDLDRVVRGEVWLTFSQEVSLSDVQRSVMKLKAETVQVAKHEIVGRTLLLQLEGVPNPATNN